MDHRTRTVVFDFDYTLADSAQGAVDCINFALEQLGLPAAPPESACRTIGLSLPDTLVSIAGPQHAHRSAEFARLFVERADLVMASKTVLLEPVPRVARQLRERGLTLGIVSTKFRRRIEAILRREGLLDLFDVIVGGEDVSRHKPDPEGLELAIGRLGASFQTVLYVGDSVTDAEAARQASVPFVAVLSGVTPREAFQDYVTYEVLDDLSELPALLR